MEEISFIKDKRIRIRVNSTEEKVIKEVAEKRNMSVSEAIRTVINEEWVRLQAQNK